MPSVCLHLSLYFYKIISMHCYIPRSDLSDYSTKLHMHKQVMPYINFLDFKLIDLIYIAVGGIHHKVCHLKYLVTFVR